MKDIREEIKDKKILKQSYHRNGVGGIGFDVFLFREGKRKMFAIKFENEEMCCAVFDFNLLKKEIIEFEKNSWRGDYYSRCLQELNKSNQ